VAFAAAAQICANGFASALHEVAELTDDADTIGSIAGNIAGAALGARALPRQLMASIPDSDTVLAVAERFAALASS
jgi:ADP-ribosylglycohydrolase